jgi:hypothetical protein
VIDFGENERSDFSNELSAYIKARQRISQREALQRASLLGASKPGKIFQFYKASHLSSEWFAESEVTLVLLQSKLLSKELVDLENTVNNN